jgi:hypothetical protein
MRGQQRNSQWKWATVVSKIINAPIDLEIVNNNWVAADS